MSTIIKKETNYENKHKKELSKLPKEACTCCDGLGMIVNKNKGAGDVIQDAFNIQIKKKSLLDDCHVCKGTGERENWGKSYPFDAENLENFVKFMSQSGGIRIC